MANGQTRQEYKQRWRENNAEHIQQQSKEYYLNDREEIIEMRRQYRSDNADKIK